MPQLINRDAPPTVTSRHVAGDPKSLRVKCVCVECNTGWMKRIQDAAKPIVVPLLQGDAIALTEAQQKILASWIAMAVMCSTLAIVDAAMEILATKREPMKLGALYDALCAKGVAIGGKEPRNNLGAKLSADRRLQTYPGIGWWFANEAIPGIDAASSFPDVTNIYPRQLGGDEHEEGPATDVTRPLLTNGAADWYSA